MYHFCKKLQFGYCVPINVIALPHTAGTTDGTSRKRAQCCADNVDRIAAGLAPLYRVA